MRATVQVTELGGGRGPRVLMLPGLGNRGAGFHRLAEALLPVARPVLVEYPEGRHARAGAGALAEQVHAAVGPVDAAIASSFGGMVAAHLGVAGRLSGAAFLSSFTALDQLGVRGRLIRAMGPIALLAGPSSLLAALAANQWIPEQLVPEVIPGTSGEKWGVWHRAAAVSRQSAPAVLRNTTIHCVALHGTRDLLVPVSVLARLKAALPEGTLTHAIKGAGHVPYLTHVGECVALLVPWLAALRIGSRDAA